MLKVVNQGTHVPVVDVVDGVATVESTNIAEVFEKRHDHVLRDIENILISLPSERRDNFIEIQLDRINNFGATVQSKAYRLTRDGFTFLVMGYTGEKAARFKWAYIDEFNRQQTLLESKALPPTQSERTMFAGDSLAENVLRGLSGQMDAETVGDKLVTIGTVLQVVGTIQKVPASGPQLQAALNAFQQALEESCDADELEKQRRRSLKARNAARARSPGRCRMMRAEITNLPMFDEYAFIEQHGRELTSDELEVLSERIDNLDRHIIAFNDATIDMLHRAISDQAFEEGSVVAANLLELLAGMQRYVYRAREALAECTTDETPSELEFSFLSDT